MIQYRVSGNIVKYKSPDNIDIHSWSETFADDNHIAARQKAIKYYQDILAEIEETEKILQSTKYLRVVIHSMILD